MSYIHLPHQQQDTDACQNIIYRDGQLWFQRVTQIDDTKFQFFNVPLDASNFTGAVRKALFPDQPSNYIPEDGLSCGRPTLAQAYIFEACDPPKRQDLPDEEVLVNLWIQSDGLEIMVYFGEDDGINYVMDDAVLQDVNDFINGILEDLKRQMMLLTSNVTATMACVEQTAGMPFQCCGQCEVCHCAE
jgi:hypothetical protein